MINLGLTAHLPLRDGEEGGSGVLRFLPSGASTARARDVALLQMSRM